MAKVTILGMAQKKRAGKTDPSFKEILIIF